MPHYEVELALLRQLCRGFSERYPGIASNLQMSGETCKDPHVERLIQASALLAARISKRLDDDYPLYAESLLHMLYPQQQVLSGYRLHRLCVGSNVRGAVLNQLETVWDAC